MKNKLQMYTSIILGCNLVYCNQAFDNARTSLTLTRYTIFFIDTQISYKHKKQNVVIQHNY